MDILGTEPFMVVRTGLALSPALRYQHATEDRDEALAAALASLTKPAQVVSIRPAATTEGE